MTRAAVLGGCGFVGRHIVQKCLSLNWEVDVIDDLSSGIDPANWEWGNKPTSFYKTDVRDLRFDGPCEYDYVFHCAAVVGGRIKIEGGQLAVANNLAIDASFFNWAVKAHPKKVIYFSSSAVYPIQLQSRFAHCSLAESLITFDGYRFSKPDLTYGWSKLSGEYLAQIAAKQYGLDVVIYRPFSGYGFDQSLDYPFPSIIARAVRRENPIAIWGSGDQERDFIHIDDVVDGVFATMNSLPPGGVLNLGTGQPTSFKDLAAKVCDIVGYAPVIIPNPSKPEGVFSRVAGTYKLEQLYKPSRTLNWGITECAQWLTQTLK